MEASRRKDLESRRASMARRGAERGLVAQAGPALGRLIAAGEDIRLCRAGEEPAFVPDWLPAGSGQIPWHAFPDTGHCHGGRADVLTQLRLFLSQRLDAEDRLLVCGQIVFDLPFALFDRHAEAILDGCDYRAWILAPPAQWLFEAQGSSACWRDGTHAKEDGHG